MFRRLDIRAVVLLVAFAAGPARAQEAEEVRPPAAPEDVATIDAIITASYDVISGPAEEERDWDRERSLFHPKSHHLPTRPVEGGRFAVEAMHVDEFIANAGPYFEREGFYEREIARRTERFGNIAHVFSTYEWRNEPDGEVRGRGINSFQLFFDGERWWILNVFWQGESEGTPIPDRYLTSDGRS
jgi:hypothetical protein